MGLNPKWRGWEVSLQHTIIYNSFLLHSDWLIITHKCSRSTISFNNIQVCACVCVHVSRLFSLKLSFFYFLNLILNSLSILSPTKSDLEIVSFLSELSLIYLKELHNILNEKNWLHLINIQCQHEYNRSTMSAWHF